MLCCIFSTILSCLALSICPFNLENAHISVFSCFLCNSNPPAFSEQPIRTFLLPRLFKSLPLPFPNNLFGHFCFLGCSNPSFCRFRTTYTEFFVSQVVHFRNQLANPDLSKQTNLANFRFIDEKRYCKKGVEIRKELLDTRVFKWYILCIAYIYNISN